MTRRATNPAHKMKPIQFSFSSSCSCGWQGATWYGKGSRANAIGEWHGHREGCEKEAGQ
jgi:hypothetical protein